MPKRTFRLYPEEQHWCSFSDYGAILDVTERLRPKRVLEFGPGSSTLALVEGGAESIDCCEDKPAWEAVHRERLERRFPGVVRIHDYVWSDPLQIPTLFGKQYDLALIDGPRETTRRPAVIEYALQRCSAVVVCTEDHNCAPFLRPIILDLAAKHGRAVEIMETGPLAGGFAVLT